MVSTGIVPVCVDEDGDGFGDPGIPGGWLSPLAVGKFENPSYGVLDLRVAYLWRIGGRWEADFFLDIFNVLDDQQVIRVQDLTGGGDGFEDIRFAIGGVVH